MPLPSPSSPWHGVQKIRNRSWPRVEDGAVDGKRHLVDELASGHAGLEDLGRLDIAVARIAAGNRACHQRSRRRAVLKEIGGTIRLVPRLVIHLAAAAGQGDEKSQHRCRREPPRSSPDALACCWGRLGETKPSSERAHCRCAASGRPHTPCGRLFRSPLTPDPSPRGGEGAGMAPE